jgi:hypothetical protein
MGDNLLIAGTTDFDSTDAALTAILNEWSSGMGFATRVGQLTGAIPGGLNGADFLTPATVHANGARNFLFAVLGNDWCFWSGSDFYVQRPGTTVTAI